MVNEIASSGDSFLDALVEQSDFGFCFVDSFFEIGKYLFKHGQPDAGAELNRRFYQKNGFPLEISSSDMDQSSTFESVLANPDLFIRANLRGLLKFSFKKFGVNSDVSTRALRQCLNFDAYESIYKVKSYFESLSRYEFISKSEEIKAFFYRAQEIFELPAIYEHLISSLKHSKIEEDKIPYGQSFDAHVRL